MKNAFSFTLKALMILKVCCHTVAIANKLNVLSTLISKLNAKSTTEQVLMNSANVSRDKNCEKKKTKATQKRKGLSSNKPQKIARLSPFPDRGELELSQPPSTSQRHTNTVSAKPDLQQSFHFPNTFLQLPPSQNPVINFSTTARDLKDSFQEVTVPQPMPKIVAQNPQQKYAPNQATSYPTFQNPLPNLYVIAILKYCHKNVSVCYGCSGRFRENGYPIHPNDMIMVSKTERHYTDPNTHQKTIMTDFSSVNYHFHQACLSRHNVLFTPQLLMLPPDIKPFLLPEHILCLQSRGINI